MQTLTYAIAERRRRRQRSPSRLLRYPVRDGTGRARRPHTRHFGGALCSSRLGKSGAGRKTCHAQHTQAGKLEADEGACGSAVAAGVVDVPARRDDEYTSYITADFPINS